MRKLLLKPWFLGLVLFLPFTGIIHGGLYFGLLISYFVVFGYYIVLKMPKK